MSATAGSGGASPAGGTGSGGRSAVPPDESGGGGSGGEGSGPGGAGPGPGGAGSGPGGAGSGPTGTGGTDDPMGGNTALGGAGGQNTGEPAVRFIGRFADEGGGAMRFEWSGSGVQAAFEGDAVSVTLQDGGSNQFTVLVDGELKPTLVAQSGSNTYELATGLPPGPHTVELYRRTEASFGATVFEGFSFGAAGALLAPPPAAARKLEIIGDSISCGYGNEGASATCGFSAETENHYLTYGALAARALDAEVVTIAWSGKGVVYNYDTDTNEPLPALYDRTLPSQASSVWDFPSEPDAVVINLGTNDFSTDGDPTPELFHDRYLAFLEHLRAVYPGAFILCTVGPLLGGADLAAAQAGISSAVSARQGDGDMRVAAWEMNIANNDPGCDYHPSVATHQAMADALVTELRAALGW